MLLALAATAAAGSAHAQQARPAGNPLEALPQINAPQRSTVTVQVEPQAQQVQALLARHLTPSTIRVEGVKSIPFDLVSSRFTPLVGKDITIGQLIETANGVTKLYQERGYALSFAFVPAQTFEDGVVRVTIVEGYVGSVQINGNAGPLESKLRAIAAHITADRPLRKDVFERYVNTFGLLPGLTVKANVPPPQNTDGATTMSLDVTRKPFNVSSGIATTSPGVQGVFTVTESGLTSLGEQLSISALAPKGPNNVTYVAASASVPIGSNGLTARVDASHYRGNPTDNPGLPSYVQRTVVNDKIGVSTSYPILLSNQRSLLATVSGYASHSEDNYQNQIGGQYIGLRSQVRVLQAQMDFTNIRPTAVTKVSLNVAKAFDILGASKSAVTNIAGSTSTNPASITFVRTGGTLVQTNQWPYKIGTTVQLTGQYSAVSLPTTEQIAFGAQRFALGYEPGEASGDSGWGMSAEINRQFTLGYAYLKSITPYVAYDMARLYLHAGTPQPNRLSSVGIGVRVSDGQHYNVDLNVAKAIGDAPIESASRSPRINASFSYQLH